MKWKTHQRITLEVMNRLGLLPLPKAEYQRLMDGVVDPDNWDTPPHHLHKHHENKHQEIKKHLELARRYLLKKDTLNAYYNLGVALHYIQDSFVSHTISEQAHIAWEKRIDQVPLVPDINEIIQITVNNQLQKERCWWFAQQLSRSIQGREETFKMATLNGNDQYSLIASPEVDYYLGFWASYRIADSILSPTKSAELEGQLKRISSESQSLLKITEIRASKRILELITKRDELVEMMDASNGLLGKIKNKALDTKVKRISEELLPEINSYFKGEHFEEVFRNYNQEIHKSCATYENWYDFEIPQLSTNHIRREILDIKAISKILDQDQQTVKNLLTEYSIPIHIINSLQIVRHSDLDIFLKNRMLEI